MVYMCPDKHYVPSTYGEVTRGDERGWDGLTTDERESRRQQALDQHGRPSADDVSARMDWNWDMRQGRRCWYCGAPRPTNHATRCRE
jgi:hypothetical protein